MSSSFYQYFGAFSVILLIVWLTFKLIRGLWTCFLGHLLGFGVKWCPSSNTWAVITGGTDGIGLAYAQEMAKKGYNLLIISRSEEKLNKTKEELQAKYKSCSQIRTLAIDLTRSDVYDKIEKEIRELDDIHVLVNNVGISYTYPEYFTQIPNSRELIDSIINCNIISCTRIIQLVLPKMERKGRGIVINVSSYSATYPTPLLSLYASTKIYVDYLSRALHVEYADKGIVFQSVLPAYVSTKMSKIRRSSVMVPTPQVFVRHALRTVGIESRTYGYWAHKLQGFVQDSLISNIFGPDLNIKLAFNALQDVRRRYYKKEGLKEKVN